MATPEPVDLERVLLDKFVEVAQLTLKLEETFEQNRNLEAQLLREKQKREQLKLANNHLLVKCKEGREALTASQKSVETLQKMWFAQGEVISRLDQAWIERQTGREDDKK